MADCTDDNHGDGDVLSVPPLDPAFFAEDINFSFDDSTFADDFENFDSFLDDLYFPEDFPNLTSSPASDFINQPVVQSQTCQTSDDLNSPDRVLDLIQSESSDAARDSNFPETKKNVSQDGFGFSSSQGSDFAPSHPSVDSSNSVNVDVSKENVAENSSKKCLVKRKKENEDVTSESRKRKHGKSNVDQSHDSHPENDDEDKKKARLIRNRESAHLSRQRKKHYVEELEDKLRKMHSAVNDLNSKISYIMAENASLKQQLSSTNTYSTPHMAPQMAPMPFPWVPYMPYFANPHGSKVPLLPIPKLQRKPPSKTKTKKVASVSVLGMFFFILLIRGLVPMMTMEYKDYDNDYGQTVKPRFNGTRDRIVVGYSSEKLGHVKDLRKSYCGGPESNIQFSGSGNKSSEPLFASLYVRRNDSMVKIDGNLIIHSAMATEEAMAASQEISTNRKETSLVLASGTTPTALMESKSTADEGELRKWFHEDLAGPMLSSGMCTEVFQFDVLPSPKTIKVPATSVKNISSRNPKTSSRNRRILENIPRPIPLSNLTNERFIGKEENSHKKNNNSSVPSVVVSVLIDPKEASSKENGFEGKKSLSRVFVVLLLDGVKYVTYSCMIPLMGSSTTTTHLVPA
jgi:hypothetical protein